MPKVTVIIPVYGVEKCIERCARSLFEQTLDDMEFIFVDDCSPDRSIEILESILEEYPVRKSQTQIIRLPENGGLPHARKTGIEKATGEYIIHCDSDDWVDVTMYEKLYCKAIEENADMVVCDYYDSDGTTHNHYRQQVPADPEGLLRGLLNRSVQPSVWNKLVRRKIFEHSIVFPEDNMGEDLGLTPQLAFYCQRIAYIAEPLYYYYDNPFSISHGIDFDRVEQRVHQLVRNAQIIESFIVRQDLTHLYSEELMILKFSVKMYLVCNTEENKGRKLWHCLYPELKHWKVIGLRHVSPYSKMLYMLASIGLFMFFRRIKYVFLEEKSIRQ